MVTSSSNRGGGGSGRGRGRGGPGRGRGRGRSGRGPLEDGSYPHVRLVMSRGGAPPSATVVASASATDLFRHEGAAEAELKGEPEEAASAGKKRKMGSVG